MNNPLPIIHVKKNTKKGKLKTVGFIFLCIALALSIYLNNALNNENVELLQLSNDNLIVYRNIIKEYNMLILMLKDNEKTIKKLNKNIDFLKKPIYNPKHDNPSEKISV